MKNEAIKNDADSSETKIKSSGDSRKSIYKCRCDAYSSGGKVLLRSIKFVEIPDNNPELAQHIDMTYCVVELSADKARQLAKKLLEISKGLGNGK